MKGDDYYGNPTRCYQNVYGVFGQNNFDGQLRLVPIFINKMLADCKSYNNADSKNGWKNFLLEKCGIDFTNKDTGAITGSDAGGSTSKTTESIVPESGSLKKFTGDSFTVNGLKFKLAESFDNLSDKEKFIWQCTPKLITNTTCRILLLKV